MEFNPANQQEKESVFEVEKRSLIDSEKDFSALRDRLEKEAELIDKKELLTYLFKKPQYLRLRLNQGENEFVVTEKIGDYSDKARQEVNFRLSLDKASEFIAELKEKGFEECAGLRTRRWVFKYDTDINIEMNIIDYLGMIVEVEAVTPDEAKIEDLERKILEVMKGLNLNVLGAYEYQKMMDDMYRQATVPISEIDFNKKASQSEII